jgi:phage tail-like protein
VTDLVPTFRFRIGLTRSTLPGRTGRPPPDLTGSRATDDTAAGGPDTLGDGGFAECSGLDLEMEVHDLGEGGRNDGVLRRLGRVKPGTVVLRRGMLVPTPSGRADRALWAWLQGALDGSLPVPRYDGGVEVLDATNTHVLARWSFSRGLPAKVGGPALNAKTGEIAIEELQIAHEGLRLEES